MVDVFVLLLLPGGGDMLQGMKRGILECADIIAINKADGSLQQEAKRTQIAYAQAQELMAKEYGGWKVPVILNSSENQELLTASNATIDNCFNTLHASGYIQKQREHQAVIHMHHTLEYKLRTHFYNNTKVQERFKVIEEEVRSNKCSSYAGAEILWRLFLENA
jgi:LAO/AO transport system kinase